MNTIDLSIAVVGYAIVIWVFLTAGPRRWKLTEARARQILKGMVYGL